MQFITESFVSSFRQLYQLLSYLLFFFNVMYGLVMCMLRSFSVFIFTTLMLFRLDWDVYMRGLEGWDTGIVHVHMGIVCTHVMFLPMWHNVYMYNMYACLCEY